MLYPRLVDVDSEARPSPHITETGLRMSGMNDENICREKRPKSDMIDSTKVEKKTGLVCDYGATSRKCSGLQTTITFL